MGKRIIQQARGKGSLTYRVRKRAFMHKIKYPMHEGEALILELIHSAGHSAPLMKLKIEDEIFYNPAFNGAVVGEKVIIGKEEKAITKGIDTKPIGEISIAELYPLGRLTLFTQKAIEELGGKP